MQYRPEIDGLRAIAILPVILFHAGLELFSGGFVGVDVFFVISGYLITSILLKDIEQENFSILDFYERRARRLLPALFTVMLVSIPFALNWMLPEQLTDFAQSLVATSVFSSNILFWLEADYFAPASETSPLLHTWSLAVEEQSYIGFPILLTLLWRFGERRVFLCIVTIAIMSLSLSEFASHRWTTANFYLLPTRAWELLAGVIAALIARRNGIRSNNTLAGLGLLVILVSIVLFDKTTLFPGVYALLPVTGAVLIVLFAAPDTRVAKFLSSRVLVGIGLVSYSAYLWHQPIFAFAKLRFPPGEHLLFVLIAATFVIAWLSWRYIEQPFRQKDKFSPGFILTASPLLLFAFVSFGALFSNSTHFEKRFASQLTASQQHLPALAQRARNKHPDHVRSWQHGKCFYGLEEGAFSHFDKEFCLNINKYSSNILLLGDSHAAHWYFGLQQNFPDANFMQATASGCRPLKDAPGKKRCTDLTDYIFNDFLPEQSVDTIILSARWREVESRQYLTTTIEYLSQFAGQVVILGPTVEYVEPLPHIILRQRFTPEVKHSEAYFKQFRKADITKLSEIMAELVANTNAQYLSVVDVVCPNGKCAIYTDSGMPLAFDYGHLTPEGSAYLINLMRTRYVLNW